MNSCAAASVDYETDSKIQDTIAREFKDRTILCIARTSVSLIFLAVKVRYVTDRLRTIISYDRICVLDAGKVAVSAMDNYFSEKYLMLCRNSTHRNDYTGSQMEFLEGCVTDRPLHLTT